MSAWHSTPQVRVYKMARGPHSTNQKNILLPLSNFVVGCYTRVWAVSCVLLCASAIRNTRQQLQKYSFPCRGRRFATTSLFSMYGQCGCTAHEALAPPLYRAVFRVEAVARVSIT